MDFKQLLFIWCKHYESIYECVLQAATINQVKAIENDDHALHTLLFSIALAGLLQALSSSRRQVKVSIYEDNICIWVSGCQYARLACIAEKVKSTHEHTTS